MKLNSTVNEFMNNAKDLSRNPLGIIALFISLIYGFAVLLIGVSAEHLTGLERLILICFIVLFPILVLITFYNLVTKHHKKLYAPKDFRDDSGFLEALNPKEKMTKIVNEMEEQGIETEDTVSDEKNDPTIKDDPQAVIMEGIPDTKKHEKNEYLQDLNIENDRIFLKDYELKRENNLKNYNQYIENNNLKKIKYNKKIFYEYKMIEDRVIDLFTEKFKTIPLRDIRIKSTNISFDAIFECKNSEFIALEIKYAKNQIHIYKTIENLSQNYTSIKRNYFRKDFKIIVAVVYDNEEFIKSFMENNKKLKKFQLSGIELFFINKDDLQV